MSDSRIMAEEHWLFIEGLLERVFLAVQDSVEKEEVAKTLEVFHYLYVEAMVHGCKHREGECKK